MIDLQPNLSFQMKQLNSDITKNANETESFLDMVLLGNERLDDFSSQSDVSIATNIEKLKFSLLMTSNMLDQHLFSEAPKVITDSLFAQGKPINSVEQNTLDLLFDENSEWELLLKLDMLKSEVSHNSNSSESNELTIKLVLWGSIATGVLSNTGSHEIKETEEKLFSEVSSLSLNHANQVKQGRFYIENYQTVKPSSSQHVNNIQASDAGTRNITRITHDINIGLSKSSYLSMLFLDVLQPQKILVTGDGKKVKLWIRDYISESTVQLKMIENLVKDMNDGNYFEAIHLNGEKVLTNKAKL